MFVPVCDRPSVAERTGAQDRAVMETKAGTIHRKNADAGTPAPHYLICP